MTNPDELSQVALLIFRNAMEISEAKALADQLVKDPEVNRQSLFLTAFCMGASSAINDMTMGRIVQLAKLANQSDS